MKKRKFTRSNDEKIQALKRIKILEKEIERQRKRIMQLMVENRSLRQSLPIKAKTHPGEIIETVNYHTY